MADLGFVQTQTAQEYTDQVKNEEEAKRQEEKDKESLVTSLVQEINKKWADAKDAKQDIETSMLDSLYQRRGEYNPTKLAQIKAVEQPEIFMNITETKCRNGVAQIKDIIIQPGKRPFSVSPTPLPDLPPDMVQTIQGNILNMFVEMAVNQMIQTGQQIPPAQLRQLIISKSEEIKEQVHKEVVKQSKKMADKIEDQIDDDFLQGGFYKALDEVIDDIVGLKAGIIKGPIFRNEKVKRTIRNPETGKLTRIVEQKIVPQYERRSPFCIYPSPRSIGVNNGYLFDVLSLKPKQLYDLIGVEGFDEKEIRACLKEFQNGETKNDWLDLSSEAKEGFGEEDKTKTTSYYPYENIYCLELWDEISGKKLLDWGMSPKDITDEDDEYPVCVWMIGNHVIKAMLNYDMLGRKPFYITSFHKLNDSFWGRDIPEMIADSQQVCNACARAIISNVGISSGPMLDLNIDRLEPGASRKIWPWRVFPTTDESMASGSKAINFYQPEMVTEKLISVYNTFSKIADEHCGVPAFSHGDTSVGGAGNTSSGLHQLREMAAQGIRAVVRNIDQDIIVPCLEYHYDYLLDNQDIYGLIGDYHLVAEGSSALIAKEQQTMRKNEFLQATANPVDIQLVGIDNRRKMLFDVAKSLGIEIEEELFPKPPTALQPQAPNSNPQPTDESGTPTQGVENRTENPKRPRQPVPEAKTPIQGVPQMLEDGGVLTKKSPTAIVGENTDRPELVQHMGDKTVVTPLPPMNEEGKFQEWIRSTPWFSEFKQKYGEEPDLNTKDYDYRSAWKAGVVPQRNEYDGTYHWGSGGVVDGKKVYFKSENHPTMWMQKFMEEYGFDPQSKGITKEQYLEMQKGR